MKRSIVRFALFGQVICFILLFQNCKQVVPDTDMIVKKIVASMTLEEKARMVVGTGMFFEIPDSLLKYFPGGKNPFASDSGMSVKVPGNPQLLVPGAAGTTADISRVGIVPMILTDGPAGLRIQPKRIGDSATYYCTAFPVATVLASTWDTSLVRKVGQAMGNEVHEYGADILLAPALNIHRNPLNGRNFEYYSEDPLVAGKIAVAMVKGIQSQGVGTSIKHFVANNQETSRTCVNEFISERALREIYLEGFRIAVQEGEPWTVMSSYNLVNGTYTSENYDLITKILRNDWGFKGFVMTDWEGGIDPVAQMKAGNDLIEPGNVNQSKKIVAAVKAGKLDEKILNQNVERILKVMLKAPRYNKYKYSNKPDLVAHAKVTRQAATDGMVLLKNHGAALPFASGIKNIAAFGNTSYEIIKGGTGSGNVNAAYSIALSEGLQNAGFKLNTVLQETYTGYIKEFRKTSPKKTDFFSLLLGAKIPVDEMQVDNAIILKMATDCDIAIITIGRNSGEGRDRQVDGDFNLTETETTLIKNVSEAFHAKGKKAVVILNIGGVIETASWRSSPDAILLAWQPGQEAGNSIADVVSGKVNPSGKLTSSFPIRYSDVPSAKNFPGIELPDSSKNVPANIFMKSKPMEVTYEEDIYVGYRYYLSFQVPVAYEFGYGLSYTQFTYQPVKLSESIFKNSISVSLEIKNTGKVAGREVVQLYIKAPSLTMNKPEEELKSFAKTKLLGSGESETIHFEIQKKDLTSFDVAASSWMAEAGNYEVRLGASSADIRQKATFKLENSLTVEKVSKALAPSKKINVLKK